MRVECYLMIVLLISLSMAISYPSGLAGGGRRRMQKQRHKFSFWNWKKNQQETATIYSRVDERLPSGASNRISSQFHLIESTTTGSSSSSSFPLVNSNGCDDNTTTNCSKTEINSTNGPSIEFSSLEATSRQTFTGSFTSYNNAQIYYAFGCDFVGYDILPFVTNSNLLACLDLCIANSNCDHIAFDSTNSRCYIKQASNYPQPTINSIIYCGYKPLTNTTSTTTNQISTIVAFAAAVTAIAVGVGAGVGVAQAAQAQQQQQQQVQQQVANFLLNSAGGGGAGGIAPTPFNLLPIPVTGTNFRNDGGCGDGSIIFQDGNCHPILRRGPCPDRRHWLTVDSSTLRVIN